jgi:hypothetical protein
MNQCTKPAVQGLPHANCQREYNVASLNKGSMARSSSKPQYKGNASISMLMIKMTFKTPPACCRISEMMRSIFWPC